MTHPLRFPPLPLTKTGSGDTGLPTPPHFDQRQAPSLLNKFPFPHLVPFRSAPDRPLSFCESVFFLALRFASAIAHTVRAGVQVDRRVLPPPYFGAICFPLLSAPLAPFLEEFSGDRGAARSEPSDFWSEVITP